jgi:DNA-binding transcriptional LysR family regulator
VGNKQLSKKAKFLSIAEALTTLPLIEHPSMKWSTWASGVGQGIQMPPPRITTSDLHFAAECAAAGVGLAIIPSRLVQRQLLMGTLTIAFEHFVPSKQYHVVVSQEQAQRVPMRIFLDWISKQVELDSRSPS